MADLADDAERFQNTILHLGAEPVILHQAPTQAATCFRQTMCNERSLVERFFGRLKQFRRVATRYDELLSIFREASFSSLAVVVWLECLYEQKRFRFDCDHLTAD